MARTIAIGDIHGCSAALAALLEQVDPGTVDTVIPLGDVVDRGPDTKGAVQLLIDLRKRCRVIPILGNHETMLLAAPGSSVKQRAWVQFGGVRTLDSYGFGGGVEMIPDEHRAFLAESRCFYETETHFFIHANYLPDVPLVEQPEHAARWEFLHDRMPGPHQNGKTAILGHSSQQGGEILDLGYLKCIDTDCASGGWLTALDVQSGQIWQADREGQVRQDAVR